MALYPSDSYRRNLEKLGDSIQSGPWRITRLLDLISERRFFLFTLRSRGAARLAPSVLSFRGESASAISPATCPGIHSVTHDGDRVELLTDAFDFLDAPDVDDEALANIFDVVLRTFDRFEQFGFECSDLAPQAIGLGPGGATLLPSGYILPPIGEVGRRTKTSGSIEGARATHHDQVERLIRHYCPDGGTTPLRKKLLAAAAAIEQGKLRDIGAIYQAVFDKTLDREPHTMDIPDRVGQTSTEVRDLIDTVVERASRNGIVVVRGESFTGKSFVLQSAAERLAADGFNVVPLDEWDLFSRTKKRGPARGKDHTVWLLDDLDEKAAAASDFSLRLLESEPLRGSVVLSVHSRSVTGDIESYLQRLRERHGSDYYEIVADRTDSSHESNTLGEYLKSAIEFLAPGSGGACVETFLAALGTEEKQVLELLSVAQFAMPLDLILSVFPEADKQAAAMLHRLVTVKCLDLSYRRNGPKNLTTLFMRVENTALRHQIYDSISAARRKKLHRTIALLAEQHGSFPTYFSLFHALEAGAKQLAAKHVVSYFKETEAGQRHPFLLRMCVDLTREKTIGDLPFADQVLVYREIANELVAAGQAADAEALLLECKDLIEETDIDLRLKNASMLSETYRLLADRWEALGEFKRSLDLLEDAKEQLRTALPIPEQAQLLNDIGWFQFRLGDYELSKESCRLSLNTLNATQYPLIVAQALNLMGVVHFNTSRYDESISYYEQSAYLRERSGDKNALAASYNNLALAYQSKGEYEKAVDYYSRSLELKQQQNNQVGIAGGYLNLALLHLDMRDFAEAEAKCRESLAISVELENVQLAADNYITLGDIALEGGDLEAAQSHYEYSYKISHAREAISEEMGALRRLSTICLKQSRFDEARDYADKASVLVQRIGSKFEEAQIDVILGDLELEQGRQAEALQHFEKAVAQYTSLSKYRLAATVLSKAGMVHARAGNDFEARHHLSRAQDFVRADFGRELPDEFVELQQILRAHPARTQIAGKETQKLLTAFYDLSALTDYVADGEEFFRKILDVAQRIVDPTDCHIAIRTGETFRLVDDSGRATGDVPAAMRTLFERTLLLGGLLDSSAPDASELLAKLKLPIGTAFVCIPLKAMSEDLGCLLFFVHGERLPLSNEDINFFTWLGRQIAGNLKLMLHLNADFAVEAPAASDTVHIASQEQADRYRFENLIGKSEPMKRIFRTLEKVKGTDSGILILGESGTGKSALARAAHYNSPRAKRPFQEIHCAQIPHNLLESELFGHERGSFTGAVQRKLGLCEVADGGTVFLDDINVLPTETQTKLLHFLENKSYMRLGGTQRLTSDVRIIAASNEDLEQLTREGKFREDLYYRLKVIMVELPPLRERQEDMLAIALDYLKRSCTDKNLAVKTLAPETIQIFQRAPWRGNVRELQNVLERVIILSDENVISPASLPEDFLKEVMGTSQQSHQRLDTLIDEIVKLGSYSESSPLLPVLEAILAKKMVDHVEGKNRAAGLLGISKPTLYARLRDYDKMH